MIKPSSKITHSFYESAPDLLIDTIAEINGILAKQKAKTGETESYIFWAHVCDVMKFAWDYVQDTRWILKKNQQLEAENKWLKEWSSQLSKRLEAYEVIRELKLSGQFNETVKKVDEVLSQREAVPLDGNENQIDE